MGYCRGRMGGSTHRKCYVVGQHQRRGNMVVDHLVCFMPPGDDVLAMLRGASGQNRRPFRKAEKMRTAIFLILILATQVIAQTAADYLIEGGKYLAKGELNKAEKSYYLAIKANPTFAEAYLNLGVVYYRQNAFVPAEEMLETALRLDSNLTEARQNLGVLYYADNRAAEAVAIWQDAIRLDPKYHDRSRLHLFIGIAYLFAPDVVDTGDFVLMAIDEFDQALKHNFTFVEAHYWKGRALELIPDISGAISEYRNVTMSNDCYGDAWNQWGVLLYRNGEYDEAIRKFRKALYCNWDDATYHWNLSLTYSAAGDEVAAYQESQQAIRINPDIASAKTPEPVREHKEYYMFERDRQEMEKAGR